MILREMLPERSAEDIAAGRIRLTFGVRESARPVDLWVLPIAANRKWVESMTAQLGGVWDSLDGVLKPAELLTWLATQVEPMLGLLASYDIHGDLPDRDWLENNATDQQIVSAFLGVCAAAHPLAVGIIDALSTDSELMRAAVLAIARAAQTPDSSEPTSSARPNTAGRRGRSRKG